MHTLLYDHFLLNHIYHQLFSCDVFPWKELYALLRILALSFFFLWQFIYCTISDSDFPSNTGEKLGRFFGIVEHAGHAINFEVIIDDTLNFFLLLQYQTC